MSFGPARILPLAILAIILTCAAARSQDLTFFAGGILPGDVTIQDVPKVLDSGPIYGIRIGTGFAGFLSLEHTLALSNDFAFPRGTAGVDSAKGILLNSNLLASIPVGKIVPYVTAGIGFIHQYGSGNLPIGTKFAVNYGGGLKFRRLLGPAGLRFDVRGYRTSGVFSSSINILELSAGVLIGF
jgi:hypothetical protein